MGSLTDFERGFLAGLIVGEAHFGTGKGNVQFVLGMHVRHAVLLKRVQELLPGSVLYGPYHSNGRFFLGLMLRGDALRSSLDIFDSLELYRWCPHVGDRHEAFRRAALTMATRRGRPRRTVS